MCRVVLFLMLMCSGTLFAQVRVSSLVIRPHQVYTLSQSDILVADTLVMMDSSTLVLNKLKPENYLRVKVARFGNHCTIDGGGVNGSIGRDGIDGITPVGPCIDGSAGKDGTRGLDGTKGLHLFIYFDKVIIKGRLTIDLSGGRGGRGGNGGNGGGGSAGTLHCYGGDGANGGMGGQGGNGGDGGVLTITVPVPQAVRDLIDENKLFVNNSGGAGGPSGKGGYHGGAGLGPSRRNGKDGEPGAYNKNGISGEKGDLIIQAN